MHQRYRGAAASFRRNRTTSVGRTHRRRNRSPFEDFVLIRCSEEIRKREGRTLQRLGE